MRTFRRGARRLADRLSAPEPGGCFFRLERVDVDAGAELAAGKMRKPRHELEVPVAVALEVV